MKTFFVMVQFTIDADDAEQAERRISGHLDDFMMQEIVQSDCTFDFEVVGQPEEAESIKL